MSDQQTTTETGTGIAGALSRAQGEFPPIQKNRTANIPSSKGSYSYKYADLTDVVAIVRPVLAKYGLAFVQHVVGDDLVTELLHSSGQKLVGGVPLVQAQGNGPQAMGSSLTYSRRYGLCALLGIVADEDDDANLGGGMGRPVQRAAPVKGTASNGGPKVEQPKQNAPATGMISEPQRKKLRAQWGDLERTDAEWKMMLMKKYKTDSSTKLTVKQASELIEELDKEIGKRDGYDEGSAR